MHKKRKSKQNLNYDINIVEALKKLPIPLITFDGHEVYFDQDKRNETIYEHIANKYHHLHVVDINEIPKILKNRESLFLDQNGRKYRSYVGLRGKKSEKPHYLRIITMIKKNNKETIVTIYPEKKALLFK